MKNCINMILRNSNRFYFIFFKHCPCRTLCRSLNNHRNKFYPFSNVTGFANEQIILCHKVTTTRTKLMIALMNIHSFTMQCLSTFISCFTLRDLYNFTYKVINTHSSLFIISLSTCNSFIYYAVKLKNYLSVK